MHRSPSCFRPPPAALPPAALPPAALPPAALPPAALPPALLLLLVLLVLVLVLLLLPAAPALARDSWTTPHPGLRLLARVTDRPWRIHALKVELCARGVKLRATASADKRRTVPSFAQRVGAEAAVNGDFFSYETYDPTGQAIGNGERWHADMNGSGEIAFGDDWAWLEPPGRAAVMPAWVRETVGGRPLLVDGGQVLPRFDRADCRDRHPRSAVGLTADRRTLILAVVDGRSQASIGMTCAELAGLMRELGAWRAMNLDGGGSSTLYVRGAGGVVNDPSDGSPRVIANHLAVQADGSGAPGSCDFAVNEVLDQAHLLDSPGNTDVDGDGRADLCARSTQGFRCHPSTGAGFGDAWTIPSTGDEQGWSDPANHATLRSGDIDGDGRADLCARGNARVFCWRSTGAGFGDRIDGPTLADDQGFTAPALYTTLRLADATGDGRADLCARTQDGFRCYPSRGAGFGEPFAGPPLDGAGWNEPDHFGTLRMGDVDGDGRADLCARTDEGMRCWRSTGDGFGAAVEGPAWSDAAGFADVARWSTIRLHDLDGDGLADLCARTAEGFHCHLAQGDGFAPALAGPALADGSGWRDHDNYGTIRLGDVDGDGRSDLCARANAGVYCWLFDGQGFGRRIDGPELSDDSGWGDWRYNTSLRLGDIDGDGRADLCARAAAGIRCWPSTGAGFGGSLAGPAYNDANGWDRPPYLGTLRLATRPCAGQEACNGRDDDCDGEVDEELSRPCSSPCGDGEERCAGGAWGACSAPAPGEERCNGADDDCDGEVDEELGRACSSPCGDGVESCTDGAWGGCSAPLPGEERCNGEDDDCDGEVDEGCACRPGESEACGSVVGLCQAGRRICREEEGVWGPCLGGVGPEAEACGNGADDDCDGEVDEGCACAVGSERACRVEGRCGEGVQRCLDGAWGECLVPAAADAVADCGEPDASPDGGEGPGTWPAGEESLAGGCTCRMGPGRGPDLRLGPPATASEPALLPLPRLLQLLLLLPLLLLPRCRRGRADGRRPAAVGASGDHPADRARAGWPRRAPAVLLALLLLPLPLLLLLLLAAGPAHAAPRITRFRLVGITRQEVQRHQLHRLLEPLLGRPATGETLREAILIVDRTQAFGHGQAELEQLGSGRALAELRFTSLPRRIDQLLFAREGWRDDPALGKQVEKLLRSRALSLDSRLGATYHPFLVDLDREKLVTIFQEQGYLDVQIRHRALRHQRLVRLVFRVELGQQVAVREVRFSGTARPPAELLKLIQTQPGKNGLLGAPRLVRARLETDVQQLTEHFRRLGYKDASITVREQRVAPDAVDVEITVREGIPYRVSRVEVKGQALPADLEGKLRTRVDQPWTQEALHADALTIATWFKDRGYPDAEAIPASTFQPPVAGAAGGEPRWGRAAVVLAIDRHAQVHVEKIWFSGNTITSRETLLKMVTVRPGELFRQSALEDSKQNMLRSGLFRDVAVEVLPGSDSGRRFVIFRVVEAFRLRLDAAGPTVTLSNLNVLSFPSSMAELEHGTLFAGGGQELQLGFAPDDLRLAFRDPYIFGFLTGSTKVSRTVSRPGGKELVVWGITPAFGLSFAQGKLVGQLFWRGEWAGLEGGGGSKASPVLSAGQDDLLLSSGGVIGRLDLTQRDDADRFPFLGLALELRYEQASSALGSELDFLGGGTGLKTYLPLGTNAKGQHAAFTFSGQLDWLHPQRDTLPYHRRFWPTLRGYTGSSLGRKEQLASPAGAAFAVGGEGAFSLELGLRLPIPLGRRNALMPFAAAGGLWEGDPPDDLSQVFTSGGLELTFSALEERLEGSLWLAYPFGGPPSGWEASYVGGSLGGSL